MKRLVLLIIISLSIMICSAYQVQFGERPEIDLNSISDDAFYQSHFFIKLDDGLTEHLDNNPVTQDEHGFLSFNLPDIDAINRRYQIREAKPLFESPALDNRYKDRHRAWGFHLWFVLRIDDKYDMKEIIRAYEKLDIISVVEPEYKKRLYTEPKRDENLSRWTPNDPQLSNQWHYNNTGQQDGTPGADISLFDAWDIEKGNSDVIVAIIDSGVQYDHADLAANMWSGIGYNFVDDNSTIVPGNHGTHVAGTVAAVNNNGIGVAGVAGGSGSGDGVRLMSCQVFTSNDQGGFHLAPVYAADNGAAISQNSWGYTQEGAYNQNVLDAIDYFNANGGGSAMADGITIFAAGNDNTTGQWYPGCYSGAFSVAATNNQDRKSWYSTYDNWVDISAPGGETDQVTARGVLSTITGGSYAYYQGTSMACPHASGVAALIISHAYGELTAGQVADILRDTTDDHYSVNPDYIGQLGTGRLNAYAALLETQAYLGGVLNPHSFNATSVSLEQIGLDWTKNSENDDVMILWNTEGQFGTPQPGVFYNVGDVIPGGGTVLYRGSDISFSHTSLQSGTTYYYKAYSYDVNGDYSYGITAQATTDYEPFTLPFSEDFDTTATLPEFWEIIDHQGNGQVWQFGTISGGLTGTTGNYAYLNSDAYGYGNSQNTDLITPTIDMSNHSDISLSFTHYFRQYQDVSSATLSYSIDDGESWTTIQTWTQTTTNPAFFNQLIPEIAEESEVRFRWNYTGSWGYYWCVDDMSISGTENLELLEPTDLSATAGDGVVELSWNAPESGDVQSYNIYRHDGDEIFVQIASVPQTELEYTDEDVINGVTYTYYVSAVYPEGESGASEIDQATPLATPSNLSAISGDLYVELNWIVAGSGGELTRSSGFSDTRSRSSRSLQGYNLYRDGEQINTTVITDNEYTDTDVEYDTSYSYYVTAVYSEHGESVPSNTVDIYVPNKVATPTFSPDAGLYTEATDVSIDTATEGATVNYRTSTDGGVWTDWEVYTDAITVPLDTEMDFEAYAEKDGWTTSDTAEATYTVTGTVATPTFTPDAGLYTEATDVSIETDTEGATVKYRTSTDGGVWTDWEVYVDPITVPLNTEMNFEAYAEKTDWLDSDTAAATYTITGTVATPTFSSDAGIYTEATDVSIDTTTEGATIKYRTSTDGGLEWTDWEVYTDAITVPLDTEMDFEAYAEKTDWITSETAEANYIVTGTVATPTFSPDAGIYTEATDVSIDTTTEGATIMYRTSTDGGLEWSDWEVYTDAITLPLNTEMDFEAYAEKTDWLDSDTAEATYIVTGTVATPTYSPAPGLYTEATDVSIETDTDGATIMYRTATDGGAWTDWEVYTDAISVPLDTEMDFEAYAEETGWLDSDTAEATYIVTGTVATPTYSPAPGLYTEATDVSIETDTDGATIMYRTATDGGAWTDWEVYTDAISVPLDTEMDFEAYAEKTDWLDSDTAAAIYTVIGTVATPSFSPDAGLYTEATDVSIDTATEGATIMYRTSIDGGLEWTDWEVYTDAITVTLNTEVDFQAYAEKEGWFTSETSEANYIITGKVATPEFDPEGGVYHEAQVVTISTETDGATIEYSYDGESWLEGDTAEIEYSSMLYARAYLENWADSEIAEDMYYILNPPQDLVSEAGDGYVDLVWQAPIGNRGDSRNNKPRLSEQDSRREEHGVIGYYIYRDEELIASVGLVQTYQDDEAQNTVEYTYYITALYPEGESLPSNTTTAVPLPDIAYGDVDDNGIVEAYDAALVLQYAVGMDPIPQIDPRPWEDWRFIRADVNGDDMIRAYDASLILQYALNIINVFPVQQPGRYELAGIVDIDWLIDDEYLYLNTDNSEQLYAAEFIIPNSENISFGEVEFNAQLSEYMMITYTKEQGTHVALAAAIPIEQSDYLFRIPYQSEEYEILTIDIISNVYESSLEIEFLPTETDEPIELITSLHHAYPNPFNPETNIGFSLAKAGHVTIDIYNIRGQKIQTLVNDSYEAGEHNVVWNGRDKQDREVSGGVYLYRFKSQDHIETRRMLLLK